METINKETQTANMIFYAILVLLILGSVGVTFWRIVIEKDYQVVAETSCDPKSESCFHREAVTCDGTDPACEPADASDYKTISKTASEIYNCEQTALKVGCDTELSCVSNEPKCSYTYCTDSNIPDGESCSTSAVQ